MDLWPGNSKKGQTVSSFLGDKLTTCLYRAHQRSLHLKSEAISLKRTLENYIKI